MNEHTMCCGTVADKARLCAEIADRDLRIKNLELCEDARARVAGRTLKFAMERGYNPASDENELEYIMRRFDEMAEQVERLQADALTQIADYLLSDAFENQLVEEFGKDEQPSYYSGSNDTIWLAAKFIRQRAAIG